MINSGDKFVIEIEAVYGRADGGSAGSVPTLYRAKGFRSLVFDEEGLKKLVPLDQMRPSWWEEIYRRGLDAAWGAARKITDAYCVGKGLRMEYGGAFMPYFDEDKRISGVFNGLTATEALAKIREYEERQKAEDEAIKVGDEIEYENMGRQKGVVIQTFVGHDVGFKVLCANGCGQLIFQKTAAPKKTGRHFPQIAEVLVELTNNE